MTVPSITDDLISEIEETAKDCQRHGDWYTQQNIDANLELLTNCSPDTILALITRLRDSERDAERLNWLDKQCEAYGFEGEHHGNRWMIDGPFRDLRTAIDQAITKERTE